MTRNRRCNKEGHGHRGLIRGRVSRPQTPSQNWGRPKLKKHKAQIDVGSRFGLRLEVGARRHFYSRQLSDSTVGWLSVDVRNVICVILLFLYPLISLHSVS